MTSNGMNHHTQAPEDRFLLSPIKSKKGLNSQFMPFMKHELNVNKQKGQSNSSLTTSFNNLTSLNQSGGYNQRSNNNKKDAEDCFNNMCEDFNDLV